MRIAFAAYDEPGYCGGPIVNARRLLPALRQRGHEPVALILHYGDHSPAARYFESIGISCRTRSWEPAATEDRIAWFLQHVADIEPNIFVSNHLVSATFAARWIRECGIPTIAAYRSDDKFYTDFVKQFASTSSEWSTSGLACVSEELLRKAAGGAKHTKLTAIPSGVPIPSASLAQQHPVRICYIGHLQEEQKRISRVVEAICQVLEAIPDATACLIGEGREKVRMEKLVAARNLSNRVEFAGRVEPDRLYARLEGGTAIIMLSDYEGTPGALMDGMACGLVPICRTIPGGVSELVIDEKTGLIVGDSAQDVVRAVKRLSHDEQLWTTLSAGAREHVTRNYSLDVAAERWERFCEELLGESTSRRPLRIPHRIHLPSVLPGLAREDLRRKPLWRRAWRSLKGSASQLLNKSGRHAPQKPRDAGHRAA